MNADNPSRRNECRSTLLQLVRQHNRQQAKIAALLSEVHVHAFWSHEYSSFADYCERELGMALRTAQYLMATNRRCREVGIDIEIIESVGWSKIAQLAKKLTPENQHELLQDAARLSHAQLKEKYGIEKKAAGRGKPLKSHRLCLTNTILAAVTRASAYTQSDNFEQNLDYIVQRFLNDYPRRIASRVTSFN